MTVHISAQVSTGIDRLFGPDRREFHDINQLYRGNCDQHGETAPSDQIWIQNWCNNGKDNRHSEKLFTWKRQPAHRAMGYFAQRQQRGCDKEQTKGPKQDENNYAQRLDLMGISYLMNDTKKGAGSFTRTLLFITHGTLIWFHTRL